MRCKLLKLFILLTFFLTLCVNAAFCGEQEKVAFMRDGDIWIINGDGTGETRVTTTGDASFPTWSPDGKKIAYCCGYEGRGRNCEGSEIWVKDFAGEKNYKVLIIYTSPLWASNDDIIFLKSIDFMTAFIARKNLIDNKEIKIKELWVGGMDTGTYYLEAVSLEDRLIFHGGSGGRGSYVSIIDFDGKDIESPKKPGQKYSGEDFADYNEDLNFLLLAVSGGLMTGGPPYDLCIKDLNENKAVYYEDFFDGKWSPDGKYIICVSGDNNIVKGQSGGTALTTSSDIICIAAVISSKIFYIRKSGKMGEYKDTDNYYLWSIGLDGSSPERITEGDEWYDWWGIQNIDIWYPGK